MLTGLIGGSVILGLGLTSKDAVVLLFLFVFMVITGILCLSWEKISNCLAPCCPTIFGITLRKDSVIKEQGIKQNQVSILTDNVRNGNEIKD